MIQNGQKIRVDEHAPSQPMSSATYQEVSASRFYLRVLRDSANIWQCASFESATYEAQLIVQKWGMVSVPADFGNI